MTLIPAAMRFCTYSILPASDKPRAILTTDGEIDDECSMARLLLCANEVDVKGLITSSSQYHSYGQNRAGDDWEKRPGTICWGDCG